MAIVYPSIDCRPVKIIQNRMRWLLARRRYHEVSRKEFLAQWGALREEMNATFEYQQLRKEVIARCEGICEKCKKAVGNQMAHIHPVSVKPEIALKPDNVYWACGPCHQLDHPNLELVK
jgi:5-methylcytosine-specific restriction endonuclease McrA